MAAVGGSILQISIRGRIFPVSADSDVNVKLGGFESEVVANGDGSARKIKTRVPWGFDGLVVEVDHDRGDQEFLQERADDDGFVPCTITYINGVTIEGRGTVTDELQYSSQNATASLGLMGPGEATQQ